LLGKIVKGVWAIGEKILSYFSDDSEKKITTEKRETLTGSIVDTSNSQELIKRKLPPIQKESNPSASQATININFSGDIKADFKDGKVLDSSSMAMALEEKVRDVLRKIQYEQKESTFADIY
jgi:hypothetical protein